MGLSNDLSCEAGSFSHCCPNPHWCFQSEVQGFISLCWNPGLCGLSCSPIVPPGLSALECGAAQSASSQLLPCLEASPPGCLSPPLLPVWMKVSSLTPLLLDFHTIQFSVNSGCFLFLNLLLSFFWLYEEAKCFYLHLHVGWNFPSLTIFLRNCDKIYIICNSPF